MSDPDDLPAGRRLIPPLAALTAFDAAARAGSFTRASNELALTQGAVSRQIRLLEEFLGFRLFNRVRQRVTLTPAGAFYAARIRETLAGLTAATSEVIAFRGNSGLLRLGIPPTFGTRWLIPRMSGFFAYHRDITVSFTTRMPGPFDFSREKLDAAIHFGEPNWPDAVLHKLMGEELILVAAPAIVRKLKIRAPGDVCAATLLVHRRQPDAWSQWFAGHHLAMDVAQPTLSFELFAMIFQAAVAGLGVALVPKILARDELSAGDLVPLFESSIVAGQAYYLVYPPEKADYPPVIAFREWLLQLVDVRKKA